MNSINKNRLLILAIVLVLILCYKFAISNTLELKKEYKKMAKEDLLLKNRPGKLSLLSKKLVFYDSLLIEMNLGSNSSENNLLRVINLEAKKNNIKVLDFNEPHISVHNNSKLKTFEFVLEGSYIALLGTIHAIEQENNFGEIIHLHLNKKKNHKKNIDYLTLRVLIQQVN